MAEVEQATTFLEMSGQPATYNAETINIQHDAETINIQHQQFLDNTENEVLQTDNDIPENGITLHTPARPLVNINNVVSSFSTRCHLNLRRIAIEGAHVEYRRENSMCNMKLRRPYTTASIWSSGKITCTGATSEEEAKIAARRFARKLQKLGFNVKFANFRVVNVLGTFALPFRIKISSFSKEHPHEASYEPELHPGVTFRIKSPKATLKIFSTGSITVTAPSVANVYSAVDLIVPLVEKFKSYENGIDNDTVSKEMRFIQKQRTAIKPKKPVTNYEECDDFDDSDSDLSADDYDSDVSQD